MKALIDRFIEYVSSVRRYSPRTCEIYRDVLERYERFVMGDDAGAPAGSAPEGRTGAGYSGSFSKKQTCPSSSSLASESSCPVTSETEECNVLITTQLIRGYEVNLMDREGADPRTVNQHLSVLSSFCKFLMREGVLDSNPVHAVPRPKVSKRLPVFFREEDMQAYFADTQEYVLSDENDDAAYRHRLHRLIISILYSTGIRRSELIGLTVRDVDFSRKVLEVNGKGDKMREIPLIQELCEEISLYLHSTVSRFGRERDIAEPLLVNENGTPLYPMYVERVVKQELGDKARIAGKKSPHLLRHTIATELLNNGADLNSIKEFLGHASLAATQVYTHNSIERLKDIYSQAFPRAKRGGKHGD